jgi:hypothetical protein
MDHIKIKLFGKFTEYHSQARSQTMNTVAAADFITSAHVHICLHKYLMFSYIYYACVSVKSSFVSTIKSAL